MNFLETAIEKGQTALSEFESKQMLDRLNIPITREELVQSEEDAVFAAEQIGYPVVLKACAWELMHKSETGCIELGLGTPEAVRQAYHRICEKADLPLEGILVQEMVQGSRELVVGMSRDPQFGVCVMVGFGGVLAEVIEDTVFRVAPFDKAEALDMIDELKSRTMLDGFRGQEPADLEALCQTLAGVGRLGLEQDAIAEIDINPLIISPTGRIKAADALIILKGKNSL